MFTFAFPLPQPDMPVFGDKHDRMKFTVTRYNAVPTADNALPAKDGELPQNLTDQLDGPTSSDSIGSDFTSIKPGVGQPVRGNGLSDTVARRGRMFAKRQKRRLVFKDGECNISLSRISKRKRRYLGDMFTTLLDMRWRYNLLMFALAFLISWLVFALLWWLICIFHSDHLHENDPDWLPCVANVHNFVTALLFSIETQHTIGYGVRAMEPKCPEAVILLMLQSCVGVFIQSLMTGIIFAKISRPKGRAHTIMFSKCAVICQRDGVHALLFRVADMRKSHIVGATIRAMVVKNRITQEGELLPLSQFPLEVQAEHGDNNLFLVWPVTIIHKIDENSPLWEMSAERLITERFEVVVILEGTVESTGMTTQVRTSYLPWEILWGHRLSPLVTYQKENGQYKIDYTQFHSTTPVAMPEVSAKHFAEGKLNDSDSFDLNSPLTLSPRILCDSSTSFSSEPQNMSLTPNPKKKKPLGRANSMPRFRMRKAPKPPKVRLNGLAKFLANRNVRPADDPPPVEKLNVKRRSVSVV